MKTFILTLVLFFTATCCWAAEVTCTWNPNTEADLAGYRLFQRSSGEMYNYAAPVAEIPAGMETCTLADIPDGDWRFVLRAFDLAGNESGDSNEVSKFIDDPPAAPVGFG